MPAAKPIAPRRRRLPTGREDEVVNKPKDAEGKPLHHYVLVSRNTSSGTYNVGHYMNMGYRVVPLTADGPRVRGVPPPKTPQAEQEWMGCILMCIDMDEYESIQEYGLDGQGGRALMEKYDRQMIAKIAKTRDSQYVDIENETTPQEFVREA